jgi:hypothetical protein
MRRQQAGSRIEPLGERAHADFGYLDSSTMANAARVMRSTVRA